MAWLRSTGFSQSRVFTNAVPLLATAASGQLKEAVECFEVALASLEAALDFLKGSKEEDQEQMQVAAPVVGAGQGRVAGRVNPLYGKATPAEN